MAELTPAAALEFCVGRLAGLSGTARYDISDELRAELKEIADRLSTIHLPTTSK